MARSTLLTNSQIESRIDGAYYSVEVCKGFVSDIAQTIDMSTLFAELNSRTPGGKRRYSVEVVGYARGYSMARWNDIFRNKVEFAYRHPETLEIFSTHKESVHRKTEEFYARNAGPELNDYETAHVWRGTDKPIAEWEKPRTKPLKTIGKPVNE